jgi:hypothetical protein
MAAGVYAVAQSKLGGTLDVVAYLDAGSGSMILQMLVGGLAAVGVTAKLYWSRIKTVLRIGGNEPERQSES